LLWFTATSLEAQVVNVTMSLETNRIPVGGSTTLRVFASVVPSERENADRIFSWYVNLLNSAGTIARADYAQLSKPTSDNDPLISAKGVTEGFNQTGIYDTFLNLPGAGVAEPVLLFAVPVTGIALGKTTFKVQAGTGVSGLSEDFTVAPAGGGDLLMGGNYSSANIDLQVIAAVVTPPSIKLTLKRPLPPTPGRLDLSFNVTNGWNYFVEWRTNLTTGSSWQKVSTSPLNTGTISLTNTAPRTFYRVQAVR
jgi:hypothetical protein